MECSSRLGLMVCPGLLRMETKPKIIQKNLQEVTSMQRRLLCFLTDKTDRAIHIMESRPLLQISRCSATKTDSQVSLYLPAIFSNREGCKKARTGQSKDNINKPHMTVPVLVSNSTQNEYTESFTLTKFQKFTAKSPGGISAISSDRKVSPSCLVVFQQQLPTKGMSRGTTKLVTSARIK